MKKHDRPRIGSALTILALLAWALITAAQADDRLFSQDEVSSMVPATQLRAPRGDWEDFKAPGTLDLVERAEWGIHGIAGMLDPKAHYEFWWSVYFNSRNPGLAYDARSFASSGPKFLESFPMMIVMTGSNQYDTQFNGLKNLLVSWIGNDGLMYCRVGTDRPWDQVGPEDYANVYGQARMMLAMMALAQMDGNPMWLRLIRGMADGLSRIAIDKGDYAYYPVNMGDDKIKTSEGFCYPRSGWYDTEESRAEKEGAEGSIFMYHCGVIRALARWYSISADEKAIRLAGKLVNYVMNDKFWGTEQEWPKTQASQIIGFQFAHFTGHFHGHAAMLFALLEYANAINDQRIKEFVRSGYEYARNLGIARLGLFGETCTISDMLAIAIKLSDGGVGDYWDDVDGYVRNQLIEQQLIGAEELRKVSDAGPENPAISPPDSHARDMLIQQTLGIFCDDADLGQIADTLSIQCCTGNGTQGLYYAWEGIVRLAARDHVQVNLLLNRVSPWMDINSWLPYEGKVVLRNKTARSLALRIPNWVNHGQVKCLVNSKPRESIWVGNYITLNSIHPKDKIVITFPMEERTTTYAVLTRQQWTSDPCPEKNPETSLIRYVCYFKGNTLVDFSPRPDGRWYANYQREDYRRRTVPMRECRRFVTESILKW